MYKRIGYVIFALLISISCFAQFETLQAKFTNDSTAVLDTTGYANVLDKMMRSEVDSYEVHRVLYARDSSQVELSKMADCTKEIELITIEKTRLYDVKSIELGGFDSIIKSILNVFKSK